MVVKTIVNNKSVSCMRVVVSGAVGDHFDLLPGVNEVPTDAWERALASDFIIRHYVEKGTLEVTRTIDESKSALAGLAPKKALAMVNETINRALLDEWLVRDSRAVIKAAVQSRIAALTPPPPKDEE